MNDCMMFTVQGTVKGKARPRFTRNGHAYSSPGARDYERAIRAAWEHQTGGRSFGGAPVRVVIDVMRQLPKSRPKRVTAEPDIYKPDADNIAKAVLDAIQGDGGAFDDDSQVIELRVTKHDRARNECDEDIMCVAIFRLGEGA